MREASRRVLGLEHYYVQILGGVILHNGDIAEMKNRRGKTLVATLAACLNAVSKKGVHIVTVNDYLARRDSEWMGKLYNFLGYSVGLIVRDMSPEEKKGGLCLRYHLCDKQRTRLRLPAGQHESQSGGAGAEGAQLRHH